MITKLILKNWRSHENSEFDFGKGTNVIIGVMGSGKSTAMDAISFALFGTFPNLQSKKIKLDEVIMNKPEQKQKATVVLEITVNSSKYRIKREIEKGKTTTSEIRQDDRLLEGPNTQRVTEKITNLLKINYELFSRAVYSEQNNIDYFLEIPKSQRKQKIDELLQISKFEKAQKTLGTVVNRLKDRTEEKKRISEKTMEIKNIPAIEKEILEKRSQYNDNEKSLLQTEKKFAEEREEYGKDSGKKNQHDTIKNQMQINEGKITAFQTRVKEEEISENRDLIEAGIEKLNEEKKTVKQLQEKKQASEKEAAKLKSLIDKSKKNLGEFDRKLQTMQIEENLEEKEKTLEKKIEEANESVKKNYAEIELNKSRITELEETLHKLKGDKCPVCYSELTSERKQELKREKEELGKKLAGENGELSEQMRTAQHEKKMLEKAREELGESKKIFEERKWINKQKLKILEELKELERKESESTSIYEGILIKKDLEAIEREIQQLERKKERLEIRQEITQMKKQNHELAEKLKTLDYNETEVNKKYTELKETETRLAVQKHEAKSLLLMIEEKTKRLNELTAIRTQVETSVREAEYFEKTVDSFQTLQRVLQQTQTQLRQEFTDTTNTALTDVWKKIYPYGDYTDLKLDIDAAGDYALQVKTLDEKWVNVEGITSGGERSTASLSLRIALSLVLTQNLSWLILDEPTHNLDKQAIKELALTLREHLPQIVDQIFIITHEPELEKASSSYLYVLERDKEKDEPTRVTVKEISPYRD